MLRFRCDIRRRNSCSSRNIGVVYRAVEMKAYADRLAVLLGAAQYGCNLNVLDIYLSDSIVTVKLDDKDTNSMLALIQDRLFRVNFQYAVTLHLDHSVRRHITMSDVAGFLIEIRLYVVRGCGQRVE
jgi:hypothetical protein